MTAQTETGTVVATSFQTDMLDTGAINDKLIQLWAELGGPPRGGNGTSEMVPETGIGGGGLMRATTLNLLAVARTGKDARRIGDAVARLRDFLPSRTIILHTHDRDEEEASASRFVVRLELKEQDDETDSPSPRFETITIDAGAEDIGSLSSLVSPLLIAELPDILWWPGGDFSRNPLFLDLHRVVDRVIVDSAQLGRDIAGVASLRDLIDTDEANAPIVGDFTWLRLGPWRQLIAQFFDPPDVQESLGTIEEITISYADVRSDGSSGLASALLAVGWLASRLGWEIVDPLERRRAGGWWVSLRAQSRGRGREISLRLLPDTSPYARFSLRKVQIIAGGDAPGTFVIERSDEDDLITSSETRTTPLVSRMVYARRPTDDQMLNEELQRFGHDPIFEEALLFATRLLP
jgi:glucose-6-phosphate dehydrogenase assembly protein OpcA